MNVDKPSNDFTREGLRRAGDVILDLDKYELVGDVKKVNVRGKERKLLKLLIEHQGKIVKYSVMYDSLYREDEALPGRSIFRVFIRHLRKFLEEISDTVRIETIHGVGYRLYIVEKTWETNEKRPQE